MKKILVGVLVIGGLAIASGGGSVPLFSIQNVAGKGCLDVLGSNRNIEGALHQWACTGNSNQRFSIYKQGAGYSIKALVSDLCFNVSYNAAGAYARVAQTFCKNEPHRLVTFKPAGASTFTIQFLHSNQCLTVVNPKHLNGGTLLQMPCDDNDSQRFKITDTSGNSLVLN